MNDNRRTIGTLGKNVEAHGDMRAFRSIFGHAEEEKDFLAVENEYLKRTNEAVLDIFISGLKKQSKKCIDALSNSLLVNYILALR